MYDQTSLWIIVESSFQTCKKGLVIEAEIRALVESLQQDCEFLQYFLLGAGGPIFMCLKERDVHGRMMYDCQIVDIASGVDCPFSQACNQQITLLIVQPWEESGSWCHPQGCIVSFGYMVEQILLCSPPPPFCCPSLSFLEINEFVVSNPKGEKRVVQEEVHN